MQIWVAGSVIAAAVPGFGTPSRHPVCTCCNDPPWRCVLPAGTTITTSCDVTADRVGVCTPRTLDPSTPKKTLRPRPRAKAKTRAGHPKEQNTADGQIGYRPTAVHANARFTLFFLVRI